MRIVRINTPVRYITSILLHIGHWVRRTRDAGGSTWIYFFSDAESHSRPSNSRKTVAVWSRYARSRIGSGSVSTKSAGTPKLDTAIYVVVAAQRRRIYLGYQAQTSLRPGRFRPYSRAHGGFKVLFESSRRGNGLSRRANICVTAIKPLRRAHFANIC